MTIIIYKNQKPYERYSFDKKELDKVKQFCYNNNIKWYIIIGE